MKETTIHRRRKRKMDGENAEEESDGFLVIHNIRVLDVFRLNGLLLRKRSLSMDESLIALECFLPTTG